MSLISKRFKTEQKYYGQLVIGPPGAGKTTYCMKMAELLRELGRTVVTVNLDPANDLLSYQPDIDIRSLISLERVMNECSLGPNGGLIYCLEYLEKNIQWLLDQLKGEHCTNFIFDLPGQVELYCHHRSLKNIFNKLATEGHMQLCVIHMIDSHHCSDAGKFIASLILSLSAMLQLGLPHLNILTKIDLLKLHLDKLQFGIDFYTEVLDLNYLLECLDGDKYMAKYKKLNAALVSIVEDYSLVSFELLDVNSQQNLIKIKNSVDKANGYVFKSEEGRHINSMLACAMGVSNDVNELEK